MALSLPTWPGPSRMTPRPIYARNELIPSYGGPESRLIRPGTRWAWDVEYPAMSYVESLAFDDILSERDTLIMEILQPGLNTGSPGSPVVDGANQAGLILKLRTMTPGYSFVKGQWVTVPVSDQLYAYKTSAAAVVGSDGRVNLPLRTMLRMPPANGAVVDVAQPRAEGFVTPADDAFTIETDGLVRLRFTLKERE